MGTFGPDGSIDPTRGVIIFCAGKKGSGKSILGMLFFKNYPMDRVVIDVAGDDGPIGPDVITIEGNAETWGGVPPVWPEWRREYDSNGRKKPMTLRYAPDGGSATFLDDVDLVVGMTLAHKTPCALLIHEIGVVAPSGRTRPHMRRALMHNRHNSATTLILCGPRTMAVDTLVLQQSDLVFIFETKNLADRKRVAESIGWDVNDFHRAVLELGPHECLRYDDNEAPPEADEEDFRLVHMDALPLDVVDAVERWAKGQEKAR